MNHTDGVPYPTERELDEQYWAIIQGHGSPADRMALEVLTEFPRTPIVPYPEEDDDNEPDNQ